MDRAELLEILIAMVEARKAQAENFTMNKDMYFVAVLCEAEIKALEAMQDDAESKEEPCNPTS